MPDRTPAEWRDVLIERLDKRWAYLQGIDAYYEGDQRLAFVTKKFQDAYGGLFRDLTDNYMPLVVDAAAERLKVQGFRFGASEDADKDAWAIWQANGLDAEANMVHTESVKLGWAYWLVNPNGDGTPRITSEHPSQVIVACAPGDRRTRLAALKKWMDEDGYIYVNLYLPDRVLKWRTTPRIIKTEPAAKRWETIGAVSNPLGEVPIIPVPNNPSMLRGGRSDLAGGPMRVQDGINKLIADMFIGSEYQAYPQRVLLGVDVPRDENGDPIKNADLKASQSHLWFFPNETGNASAFQFDSADLENFRKAVDGLIGDLAAQTRIPIYYFRPAAISNISAEALIGLDAGLVSKTDDKKDAIGEAHEMMMRLAFKAIGDPRSEETAAETVWANTENRSQAQVVDAAVKKSAIGVPFEQLAEDIGYSPQQVDRMTAQRETDSFLAQTTEPSGGTQSPQPGTDAGVPQP